MELFLFIVITITLTIFVFSFVLQTPLEEEEDEPWDSTEVRLESLLQGVMDPRADIRVRYQNRILAMGPHIIPRLTKLLSQELFLAQNRVRILRLKELIFDFGLRAVPALLELLQEEGDDPLIAEGVIDLLRDIGPPALTMTIERLTPTTASLLRELFAEWGPPAHKAILRAFQQEPSRALWRELLLFLGDAMVEALLDAVHSWEGDAQRQAFRTLAQLAPPEAKPIFLESLDSPLAQLRAESAFALGQIADPATLPRLVPLLHDAERSVRLRTIPALAQLGAPEAVDHLKQRLEELDASSSLQESLQLSISLARLGEAVDEELLEKALSAPSQSLRFLALELIQQLEHEERFAYLERLLWDVDWHMVRRVIQQLSESRSPRAARSLLAYVEQLSPQEPRFELVEDALISLEEAATLPLLDLLAHDDPLMVAMALQILLQGRDARAVEPIFDVLLRSQEPDLEWGIESEDLLLFLQRVSTQHDELYESISRFIHHHPNTPLSDTLEEFLETLPKPTSTSQTALPSLDPKV